MIFNDLRKYLVIYSLLSLFSSFGVLKSQAACLFVKDKGYSLKEALTPQAIERGLMEVTDLGKDYGMLFVFPSIRSVNFWMKNTPLALDIIFIDSYKRIQHIHKEAIPYSEKRISSPGLVKWVIEVKAGLADTLGLKQGDLITLRKHCGPLS